MCKQVCHLKEILTVISVRQEGVTIKIAVVRRELLVRPHLKILEEVLNVVVQVL